MALVARQRELMVQQQTTATFLQSQIAALQHLAIADFSQSAAAQAAISGLQIQLYQTMNNSERKRSYDLPFLVSLFSQTSFSTATDVPDHFDSKRGAAD